MQKISIPMIGGMHVVAPNPWLIICQCLAVVAATIIVALIAMVQMRLTNRKEVQQ